MRWSRAPGRRRPVQAGAAPGASPARRAGAGRRARGGRSRSGRRPAGGGRHGGVFSPGLAAPRSGPGPRWCARCSSRAWTALRIGFATSRASSSRARWTGRRCRCRPGPSPPVRRGAGGSAPLRKHGAPRSGFPAGRSGVRPDEPLSRGRRCARCGSGGRCGSSGTRRPAPSWPARGCGWCWRPAAARAPGLEVAGRRAGRAGRAVQPRTRGRRGSSGARSSHGVVPVVERVPGRGAGAACGRPRGRDPPRPVALAGPRVLRRRALLRRAAPGAAGGAVSPVPGGERPDARRPGRAGARGDGRASPLARVDAGARALRLGPARGRGGDRGFARALRLAAGPHRGRAAGLVLPVGADRRGLREGSAPVRVRRHRAGLVPGASGAPARGGTSSSAPVARRGTWPRRRSVSCRCSRRLATSPRARWRAATRWAISSCTTRPCSGVGVPSGAAVGAGQSLRGQPLPLLV